MKEQNKSIILFGMGFITIHKLQPLIFSMTIQISASFAENAKKGLQIPIQFKVHTSSCTQCSAAPSQRALRETMTWICYQSLY